MSYPKPFAKSLSLLTALFSLTAHADINPAEVNAWLRSFDANPKAQMNAPVVKKPSRPNARAQSLFSPDQVRDRSFITVKNKFRPQSGRAGEGYNDKVENLVDERQQRARRLIDGSNVGLLLGRLLRLR